MTGTCPHRRVHGSSLLTAGALEPPLWAPEHTPIACFRTANVGRICYVVFAQAPRAFSVREMISSCISSLRSVK